MEPQVRQLPKTKKGTKWELDNANGPTEPATDYETSLATNAPNAMPQSNWNLIALYPKVTTTTPKKHPGECLSTESKWSWATCNSCAGPAIH
jgi:hypothetical protein